MPIRLRGRPEVHVIRGKCCRYGAPAEPAKVGRDLGGIQVRVVAASRADDLKQAGVTAFEAAIHYAGRLAPHERRPAVARLTGERERYRGLEQHVDYYKMIQLGGRKANVQPGPQSRPRHP